MSEQPLNKHFRQAIDWKLIAIIRKVTEIATLSPELVVKSCISCDHFNEPEEVCMKFKMKPPARIIAFSCESYDNLAESIPF